MTTEDTGRNRDERAAELLAVVADESASDATRSTARDTLVEEHLPLVRYCAQRFTGRGESLEDLTQVGAIGLIKAIDRFDPERGPAFASFATPTIIGEIRRHLRDRSDLVRLPRSLQELTAQLGTTTSLMTTELGRSPSPIELASRLEVSVEDVLEALEAQHTRRVASLDAPEPGDGNSSLGDRISDGRDDMELVDQIATLRPLMEALPERERRILALRFGGELSQAEIASELGISQMHVSRLLSKTLEALRRSASEQDGE